MWLEISNNKIIKATTQKQSCDICNDHFMKTENYQ